jgi:hypothetical protein
MSSISKRNNFVRHAVGFVLIMLWHTIHSNTTFAQCANCLGLEFRASAGLPESQCWSVFNTGTGSSTLAGNKLTIASTASIQGYESIRPPFSWLDSATMEARLRVPAGSYGYGPGFRAATYFGGSDRNGVIVLCWVWATGVALSTDYNASPGPGLVLLDFDAATIPHTYTIVTDALGASLRIDGQERARLPYTTPHPTSRNNVEFGTDSRFSDPANSEWEYVRFGTIRQPISVTTGQNGHATFTVSVSGSGPFTYQWRRNGIAISAADVPSAATSTLTITNVTNANAGSYDCLITSACGSVLSASANLTFVCNNIADIAQLGGTPGPDGQLTIDDLLLFLSEFFSGCR